MLMPRHDRQAKEGGRQLDWDFITHHLISGYIPVTAALALYFLILYGMGKRQARTHIAASYVFCFYLVGILTMTGICLKGRFSPRIVYIPFADMVSGPVDTVLNIFLFIPMGFFLPMLYRRYDSIRNTAMAGFLVSLSVETAQMFGFGTTDINDLITNTLGTCLGYGVYLLVCKAFPKKQIGQIRVKGTQERYELPLFWVSSFVIMLTLQVYIYHTLFAMR